MTSKYETNIKKMFSKKYDEFLSDNQAKFKEKYNEKKASIINIFEEAVNDIKNLQKSDNLKEYFLYMLIHQSSSKVLDKSFPLAMLELIKQEKTDNNKANKTEEDLDEEDIKDLVDTLHVMSLTNVQEAIEELKKNYFKDPKQEDKND